MSENTGKSQEDSALDEWEKMLSDQNTSDAPDTGATETASTTASDPAATATAEDGVEAITAEPGEREGSSSGVGATADEASGGDEDLAAQWAASVDAGNDADDDAGWGAVGMGSTPLDQDAIDVLLGNEKNTSDGKFKNVIEEIVNSGEVNYEKLPMLDFVFERLARQLTSSLRNFTSDNVEVELRRQDSVRFGHYINQIPLPALIAVIKAQEWDNYGLVVADSSLIYSIVDVLLGGRRAQPVPVDGRPYTSIERTLVKRMVDIIVADLSIAFEDVAIVHFVFDRLETNPKFATITRPNNAAIATRIRVDMEDRGGFLEVLLPYATLEPVREILLQNFMGEKFGRDSIWETHLKGELTRTEVTLSAVLEQQTLPIGTVMGWKKNDRLVLDASPDSPVMLTVGDTPVFLGTMGQNKGRIAVQIDAELAAKQVIEKELMAAATAGRRDH